MSRPLVGRWVVAGTRTHYARIAGRSYATPYGVRISSLTRKGAESVVAGTGLNGLDPARPTHDITITFEPGRFLRRQPRT